MKSCSWGKFGMLACSTSIQPLRVCYSRYLQRDPDQRFSSAKMQQNQLCIIFSKRGWTRFLEVMDVNILEDVKFSYHINQPAIKIKILNIIKYGLNMCVLLHFVYCPTCLLLASGNLSKAKLCDRDIPDKLLVDGDSSLTNIPLTPCVTKKSGSDRDRHRGSVDVNLCG